MFDNLEKGDTITVLTRGTGLGVYGQTRRVVEIIEVLKDIPNQTVYRVEVTHGNSTKGRALVPASYVTKKHKGSK